MNNPTTIKWSASSSQIGARTLRIRTTEAFDGGRPSITVNSWSSSEPGGKLFHLDRFACMVAELGSLQRLPRLILEVCRLLRCTSHTQLFLTSVSLGVTRGTWRGINQAYDFSIPSGVLVAGSNTIQINVISGSSGSQFLSPNFVYDSVELF